MIVIPSRYKRQSAPASGGMSHATVCRDTHLDRDVLIKELQAGVDQRRILDEIAALAAIRSKHVVQLYDVVRDNGEIVGLVEEYISGPDLEASIPLADERAFLRIAYAISCGISDIHAAGHVHRDIKPNNIKFDSEGCLKIFDFGLSRKERVDAATQGIVGTRGYIAPELCVDDDEVAYFGKAIDVYAFGATMLQLVVQTLPRPLRNIPPRLPCEEADFSSLDIGLTDEIAALMNACLEASPEDRPTMATIRDVVGAELLRDRHRATFVVQGVVHILHALQRTVIITLPGGKAQFRYDGLRFSISSLSGDVYVNNDKVSARLDLPKSCVVTFGEPALGANRVHVPIDVSHPEVVL